jgi:hypothetical protein
LRMHLLMLLLHLWVHLLWLLLLLLRHHGPGLALRPTGLAGRHRRTPTELLRHWRHARRWADAAALARRTRREAAGTRRCLPRLQWARTAAWRHHTWLSRHARLAGWRHRSALRERAGAAWPRHALHMRCQALRRRWRESTPLRRTWRSWRTCCEQNHSQQGRTDMQHERAVSSYSFACICPRACFIRTVRQSPTAERNSPWRPDGFCWNGGRAPSGPPWGGPGWPGCCAYCCGGWPYPCCGPPWPGGG